MLTKFDKYALQRRYFFGEKCNLVTIKQRDGILRAIIPAHWKFEVMNTRPCGNPGMSFNSTLFESCAIIHPPEFAGKVLRIDDYDHLTGSPESPSS